MLLLRRGKKVDRVVDNVHPSLMEQKIHPNLDSLAKELEMSQAHRYHLPDSQEFGRERLENDMAGIGGLQPSTRSRKLQKEVLCMVMDNSGPVSDHYSPEEARGGLVEGHSGLSHQDQKGPQEQDTIKHSPSQHSDRIHLGVDSSQAATKTSTIMRWSTFGKRPEFGGRTSNNPAIEQDIPSPHTFGMPTPPQSSSKSTSYFTFKDDPPPLPPLDHPAFQGGSNTIRVAAHMHKFPEYPEVDEHGAVLGNYRRFTNSLPTSTRPNIATASIFSTPKGIVKKQARPRSKSSSAEGKARVDRENPISADRSPHPSKFKVHRRNQSKSSIASSRRSSAEYSAKQASSIGHEQMEDGCWEIQVSKEMVRLALGLEGIQQRVVETKPLKSNRFKTRPSQSVPGFGSAYGRARGENWTGEATRLGSPFLLQDTLSDNLTDKQVSNDLIARLGSTSGRRVSSLVAENCSRDDVMSNGESKISPTGSSANNKTRNEKERMGSGATSSGSQSRKGGIRAKSTPSRTRTPSPQPSKLDTGSRLGSIQGSSSLLVPPSLSVIAATPEASPVSPSRRTYHKSTPTMPTSSVLKTPSTPPVIEKSHSSGSASGKRKADEAGVGGDKTPPKEPKEPRTTFAPEPRTHRASGHSATSTHAPSSFNRSKRVRLTSIPDGRPGSRSASRAGSTLPTPDDSPPNAKSTGSWSSKGSHGPMSASSHGYISGGPPPAPSASYGSHLHGYRAPSRRSLSQASIPISALISPHAPSISHSGTFHMRDPRKPSPVQSTPWSLSFPSYVQEGESRWSRSGWAERGGSPLHAWLFFIGFLIFPLWWAAALFIPIPSTRRLGGTDAEKGVMLDDPQVEHDARSWRTRCRVMAIISLFTYIPFIVLVAVFA
ncbi:hypothetical protein JR316_0006979 [Psilocybe cubensis]|uniref:Uncharacterized protein n=1 Tax=Psilocybe cubensis TaxID=181762 RepID=A0ACB8GXP1_PSICU|nr:hypothetical protein JR316_0006979 [Psilocybe cubensis]KAH9480381.1 hypothetical protein JR316_0006979 [Psilocybe cubensis]